MCFFLSAAWANTLSGHSSPQLWLIKKLNSLFFSSYVFLKIFDPVILSAMFIHHSLLSYNICCGRLTSEFRIILFLLFVAIGTRSEYFPNYFVYCIIGSSLSLNTSVIDPDKRPWNWNIYLKTLSFISTSFYYRFTHLHFAEWSLHLLHS